MRAVFVFLGYDTHGIVGRARQYGNFMTARGKLFAHLMNAKRLGMVILTDC